MKYSDLNSPIECIMTQTECYQESYPMKVLGVLWHSTGANNPNLKRYVIPDYNHPNRDQLYEILGSTMAKDDNASKIRKHGMNCWIGKLGDGSISTIQTLPWDWRPWGCGSGKYGSCNSGWIQFEICEDDLKDADYFNAAYKEACEITAFLCKKFNIDPFGTAKLNGITVPTILCHADSHELGLGSNHGDVLHWFKLYNKTMNNVREDVATLMQVLNKQYVVAKKWTDISSYWGKYSSLEAAKVACNKAGDGYSVFLNGQAIYSKTSTQYQVGDQIKLKSEAKYISGNNINPNYFQMPLYIRQIRNEEECVLGVAPAGVILGVVNIEYVEPYETSYKIKVTAKKLNVREGPSKNYKVTTQINKNEVYTIIDEYDNWGKLKSGAGWIALEYTERI